MEEVFNKILDDVKILAAESFADFKDRAEKDGKEFVADCKADIQRWTKMLKSGDLTRFEFEFLVKMRADEAKLFALTKVGMAKARLDRFRKALISIVVDRVTDIL